MNQENFHELATIAPLAIPETEAETIERVQSRERYFRLNARGFEGEREEWRQHPTEYAEDSYDAGWIAAKARYQCSK